MSTGEIATAAKKALNYVSMLTLDMSANDKAEVLKLVAEGLQELTKYSDVSPVNGVNVALEFTQVFDVPVSSAPMPKTTQVPFVVNDYGVPLSDVFTTRHGKLSWTWTGQRLHLAAGKVWKHIADRGLVTDGKMDLRAPGAPRVWMEWFNNTYVSRSLWEGLVSILENRDTLAKFDNLLINRIFTVIMAIASGDKHIPRGDAVSVVSDLLTLDNVIDPRVWLNMYDTIRYTISGPYVTPRTTRTIHMWEENKCPGDACDVIVTDSKVVFEDRSLTPPVLRMMIAAYKKMSRAECMELQVMYPRGGKKTGRWRQVDYAYLRGREISLPMLDLMSTKDGDLVEATGMMNSVAATLTFRSARVVLGYIRYLMNLSNGVDVTLAPNAPPNSPDGVYPDLFMPEVGVDVRTMVNQQLIIVQYAAMLIAEGEMPPGIKVVEAFDKIAKGPLMEYVVDKIKSRERFDGRELDIDPYQFGMVEHFFAAIVAASMVIVKMAEGLPYDINVTLPAMMKDCDETVLVGPWGYKGGAVVSPRVRYSQPDA